MILPTKTTHLNAPQDAEISIHRSVITTTTWTHRDTRVSQRPQYSRLRNARSIGHGAGTQT